MLGFRIFHSSGEVRWISALGGAEFGEAGQITRVLGVNIDIAERKRAEQKIESQLEELRPWYQAALNREDRVLATQARG